MVQKININPLNKTVRFTKVVALSLIVGVNVCLANNVYAEPSPITNQQRNMVKGKVLDDLGQPLPGAAIMVAGSTRGVTTDLDGSFEIEVASNEKLTVSFLGMQDQTITVENQRDFVIKLFPKVDELQEVTVVAYGKQKKESVIGAITSVAISDLKVPVGKISTSLAGQMAGIVAVQRSGEPGAGSDFWIRGVSSFGANNKPLILVDGIERELDLVDPEDIETFSILKDATATAIYGVRGANGVVLITTRRGKEGKPVVNARAEYGMLSPTRMPEMANINQFMKLYNEVYSEANNGQLAYSPEDQEKYLSGVDLDLYPNVDWLNTIYKDQTTNFRVNVNVSGGSKLINYYVAGSVYKENGIYNAIESPEYNPSLNWIRYNFRSNVDINLSKSTVINVNLSNQFDKKNKPDSDEIWIYSFQMIPNAVPLEYSDGSAAAPPKSVNPYNLLNKKGYVQQFTNNAQALIGLTQDFSDFVTPGLKANIKFSWDATNVNTLSRYKDPYTYWATERDEEGNLILGVNNPETGSDKLSLWSGATGSRVWYLEASSTYERLFAEKHRVGGLVLYNMREKLDMFPGAYLKSLPYRNMGVAARATYSFDDKYFIEGNFGYNGSENFAPGKKFGFFPSVAVGYLISNEAFFSPLTDVVSMLKFKGSYGKIGNDQIGGERRFAYNSEINESLTGYVFGETGNTSWGGYGIGYPGNPNVAWEEAKKMNIGVEFELFNALKMQIDYFHEDRDGIFVLRQSMPSIAGVNVQPYVNLGKMMNQGVDMSLEFNKKFGEVFVSARGTFTFNRNKKLYDDVPLQTWGYKDVVGKPWGQQFGLVALGLYESEEDILNSPKQNYGTVRPGDIKYKDMNGDGIVDDNDIIAIGRSDIPEINYGFGISAGWKGIDASFFFQGVGNVTGFMAGSTIYGFQGAYYTANVHADVADNRWTAENPNPNAKYPRLNMQGLNNNWRKSTYNQVDKSFLRLKNVELGYTIPRKITSKAGLSTLRVYMQGVNLWTIAPFKLWDPELSNAEGAAYPNMRTINFGVNLNF